MCKPAPGPRCSAHTLIALTTAQDAYRSAVQLHARATAARAERQAAGDWFGDSQTRVDQQRAAGKRQDARSQLLRATLAHDETPAGQEALRRELAELPAADPRQQVLVNRLSRGTRAREQAVRAWSRAPGPALARYERLLPPPPPLLTAEQFANHPNRPAPDPASTRQEQERQTLWADLVQRLAWSHQASPPPPPETPARVQWQEATSEGRAHQALMSLVGADADLTCAHPQLRALASPPDGEDATAPVMDRSQLLAAHHRALPAPLRRRQPPAAHAWAAVTTGEPWLLTTEEARGLLRAHGTLHRQERSESAQFEELWWVSPVPAPTTLRLEETGDDQAPIEIAVSSGALGVRHRDGAVRLWNTMPVDLHTRAMASLTH